MSASEVPNPATGAAPGTPPVAPPMGAKAASHEARLKEAIANDRDTTPQDPIPEAPTAPLAKETPPEPEQLELVPEAEAPDEPVVTMADLRAELAELRQQVAKPQQDVHAIQRDMAEQKARESKALDDRTVSQIRQLDGVLEKAIADSDLDTYHKASEARNDLRMAMQRREFERQSAPAGQPQGPSPDAMAFMQLHKVQTKAEADAIDAATLVLRTRDANFGMKSQADQWKAGLDMVRGTVSTAPVPTRAAPVRRVAPAVLSKGAGAPGAPTGPPAEMEAEFKKMFGRKFDPKQVQKAWARRQKENG